MNLKLFLPTIALILCPAAVHSVQTAELYLASGCFWCTESDFEKIPGVISVDSGYINSNSQDPSTYQSVSTGLTGATEGVRITYNTSKTSLKELLEIYWKTVDYTDPDGQFCDRGSQYRPGLYYSEFSEQNLFLESSKLISSRTESFGVQIEKLNKFELAEEYHQDYYKKHPFKYHWYRFSCGRDAKLSYLASVSKSPDK